MQVSVAIVGKPEISELNRIYRGKNGPTDVLSFANDNFPEKLLGLSKNLGEIVICPAEVRLSGEAGLVRIFIHGLLHLLGHDHDNPKEARIMRAKEQKYLTFLREQGYGSDS